LTHPPKRVKASCPRLKEQICQTRKKRTEPNIEDLPKAERELTAEEAKGVKGGEFTGGVRVAVADVDSDKVNTGADAIAGPHVKR